MADNTITLDAIWQEISGCNYTYLKQYSNELIELFRTVYRDGDAEENKKSATLGKLQEDLKNFTSTKDDDCSLLKSIFEGIFALKRFRDLMSGKQAGADGGKEDLKDSVLRIMDAYLPCQGKDETEVENVQEIIKNGFEKIPFFSIRNKSPEEEYEDFQLYLKRLFKHCKDEHCKDDYGIEYILGTLSILYYEIFLSHSFPPRSDEGDELGCGCVVVSGKEGFVGKLYANIDTERKIWTGMVLPDPRSVFLCLDKEFFSGIQNTNSLLRERLNQKEADVFWRLEFDDTNANGKTLKGNSMSGAFYALIRAKLEDL